MRLTLYHRCLRAGIVLAVVVLAGCAARDQHAADAAAPLESGPSRPANVAVTIDSSGPLVPIDSRGVQSLVAEGRARATLVNVWASWCVPCRQEFPGLVASAEAFRAQGVRLVLVSTDDDEARAEVLQFLSRHGVRGTCYLKHEPDLEFIDGLNPTWSGSLPATFVYDAAGRQVAFWEGAADRERFEAALRQALAGPGTTPHKESHS